MITCLYMIALSKSVVQVMCVIRGHVGDSASGAAWNMSLGMPKLQYRKPFHPEPLCHSPVSGTVKQITKSLLIKYIDNYNSS